MVRYGNDEVEGEIQRRHLEEVFEVLPVGSTSSRGPSALERLVGPAAATVIRANHECVKAFQVARATGLPTAKARRLLGKAERAGLVQRCARYSAINCIAWSVVPARNGDGG